jgi:hypothetical protein
VSALGHRAEVLILGRARVERKHEPSRLRRGRWATSPVFYVTIELQGGGVERWRFRLKRDAVAFAKRRGVCAILPDTHQQATDNAKRAHAGDGSVCWACEGMMVERAGVPL